MHARLKREEALVTAHVQQENDQQDDSDSVVEDDDAVTKSKCCEAGVQTDLSKECIVNLEEECCNLRGEKQQLSESIIKTAFTQRSMSHEAKVNFYTEVFCERPSDLKARALTYSNYKHHETVKIFNRDYTTRGHFMCQKDGEAMFQINT